MKKVIVTLFCILLLSSSLALAATPSSQHAIVAGDTLRKLAKLYDTTVLELLDLNPGITPDNLQIGQKVNVTVEPLWSYHVVQPGDNAKFLAKAYKVPLESLLEANNLERDQLKVGEMIRIPMHFYEG